MELVIALIGIAAGLGAGFLLGRRGGTDATPRIEALERALRDDLGRQRDELATSLTRNLDSTLAQLRVLEEAQTRSADATRAAVETRLAQLTEQNAAKLDEMRRTVDEKLQATLEKRFNESFTLVSQRLEQVHKGLGEMQTLATGVGDLKRMLTNVKTRGTWGEVQLGNLLADLLIPDQYATNVATVPGSAERVEFAIRLPGRREDGNDTVWIPIDAKFPKEDYERLVLASEAGDPVGVEAAAKALEARARLEAKTIQAKYVAPPHTTDFAIMYLPTESLYAELAKRPGLIEAVQREHRVVLAGPSNLAAYLNSLQMGFRTLAIQKRSTEVWKVLGEVKNEFAKFGDVLDKVHKKLGEASNVIEQAQTRKRQLDRRLGKVEGLEAPDEVAVLPPAADDGQD